MRSLFRYFARNHVFYLFLILEIISMVLIINYNNYQKVKYLNSANRISASIYSSLNSIVDYFQLKGINEELSKQNGELLNQISRMQNVAYNDSPILLDSTLENQTYLYTPGKVINNTVFNPYNYITINKGSKDGIEPDQGIISNNKVIGIITNTSKSYATGLTLLNMRLNISAKLKKSGQFGSMNWDGRDYRYVHLNEIPFHIGLAKGDTVVTSGYSSYFPEGVLIGTVYSFKQEKGENFYTILVELAVNFKSLSYVQVIKNFDIEEIKRLNNLNQGDEDMD